MFYLIFSYIYILLIFPCTMTTAPAVSMLMYLWASYLTPSCSRVWMLKSLSKSGTMLRMNEWIITCEDMIKRSVNTVHVPLYHLHYLLLLFSSCFKWNVCCTVTSDYAEDITNLWNLGRSIFSTLLCASYVTSWGRLQSLVRSRCPQTIFITCFDAQP